MTPEDLSAIEARAKAATEGPWIPWGSGEDWWVNSPALKDWSVNCRDYDGQMSREDAEFVAAARSDIPALVEEVRRCWAELNRVREELGKMQTLGLEGVLSIEVVGHREYAEQFIASRYMQLADAIRKDADKIAAMASMTQRQEEAETLLSWRLAFGPPVRKPAQCGDFVVPLTKPT